MKVASWKHTVGNKQFSKGYESLGEPIHFDIFTFFSLWANKKRKLFTCIHIKLGDNFNFFLNTHLHKWHIEICK